MQMKIMMERKHWIWVKKECGDSISSDMYESANFKKITILSLGPVALVT